MHDPDTPEAATPPKSLPKGEYKMMLVLFSICLALFIDSLRSPGLFQGESAGPGSIPQLVAGGLVLMIIGHSNNLAGLGDNEQWITQQRNTSPQNNTAPRNC